MAAMNGASGLRMLLIWDNTDGRSLIQCKLRFESTASKVLDPYGSVSRESRTWRSREMSLLKGRSSSRCKRVGAESAQVRCPMRVPIGADLSFVGSRSGRDRIRARLQALAPRSRTLGKLRLISWGGGQTRYSWQDGNLMGYLGWSHTSKRSASLVATSSLI